MSIVTAAASVPHGASSLPPTTNMVWIPSGECVIGSDAHYPEERPAHRVSVNGFWIDECPVTNEQFARFVDATGHVTFAELPPNPADYPGAIQELLNPGSLVFTKPTHPVDMSHMSNWWAFILGADWRHPQGPDSSLEGLGEHPVVHVAYADVEAYATWIGKEIPTEAEWEYAARGGLDNAVYAWGNEFLPNGQFMANTWQGRFPYENLRADGYEGTSPVDAFAPNGFGVRDMIGNVWEWTADWYRTSHAARSNCCGPSAAAASIDPCLPEIRIPRKVLKGGSHLCAPNYCRRYRPAARYPQPIDTSTSHVGFRLIVRHASNRDAAAALS
ncbi:MAG TPA: formylglycine-generating enzyme family protein [Gemmatimonadaceae bacterium]|nr:formylglycine-generating enzyme family protein [Gemmatimonadaceae bacterium]